jgi:hypothetical protein
MPVAERAPPSSPMPHYYLDVRFSHLVVEDETGHDFSDLAQAVRVAHALLSQLKTTGLPGTSEWLRIEISDDNGLVATFPSVPPGMPLPGAGRA